MIEEYRPGIITIDGKNYTIDIETDWNGEILPWDKKENGLIDIEDVRRAVGKGPEIIVIGTGEEGKNNMTKEAEDYIKENSIKLIVDITEEAVKTFNILKEDSLEEEGRQAMVVGLFCLT